MNKKGQLVIFVLIALLIVAGVILFLLLRGETSDLDNIPANLAPVFSFYTSCINEETKAAAEIAGTQGGYIEVPDYFPGSEYAPFSSQLNFLGFPVPYWYYQSGNGLIKKQVPSKQEIERNIENYLKETINECDFSNFYAQGFDINYDNSEVRVEIKDEKIEVTTLSNLAVRKEEESARKQEFKTEINSKLGKFYNLAREIYDKQIEEAFLERYAVDTLRLYAPVDGVELTCASKIWQTREVVNGLQSGLEANIISLKLDGNYYELDDEKDKYFVIDKSTDESVQFLYSRNWPYKIEIYGEGVGEELMTAEPVGTQEGLGIMGFCYAPYHFVYDLSFPVLVQIYNNEELFQFPVAVIIDKNVARKGLESELLIDEQVDVCNFKTQKADISIYDVNLNPVDSYISYKCFDQQCYLGETENGRFRGEIPACINGLIITRAENYGTAKELYSSNEEESLEIILDREYEVEVELKVGGNPISNDMTALIAFENEDKTISAALPEFNKIKLTEGSYDIRAFAYSGANIFIPGSTKVECVEVPKEGIFGFLGGTKEKCIDITTPDTNIDYAVIGGGKTSTYLLESEISKGKLIVSVNALPRPNSIEDLQNNFALLDSNGLEVFSE